MITLKEFMSETLRQIAEATIEIAADGSGAGGASVNPVFEGSFVGPAATAGYLHDANGNIVINVDFDIAVTAEEKEKADARVGVKVLSFVTAGGEVGAENSVGTVSRIKFRLPMALPADARRDE